MAVGSLFRPIPAILGPRKGGTGARNRRSEVATDELDGEAGRSVVGWVTTEAERTGHPVSVGVVDDAGVPVSFQRMTGAPRFSAELALAKARTAATFGTPTAELEALWPQRLPEGIVHADYFPDNVFFLGGKFAGAIDFYFAAWDAIAYDVGVALNAWCFEPDGGFNVTKAGAFLSGYRRRRALGEAELAALPILARGAAMRFFLTRLADWLDVPPAAGT